MSERPTPRTNAAFEYIWDKGMTEWTPADFARSLEREADELCSGGTTEIIFQNKTNNLN